MNADAHARARRLATTMQFQKAQSGNPAGPACGSRNRTVLMQNLLEGEAEAIARKAIEMAKEGVTIRTVRSNERRSQSA